MFTKYLLQNINSHKAIGPDGIPVYFLKEFSNEITPILTLVFQCSIQQGTLLDEWKTANIIPIFKKEDHTSTDNYHPVSLTSMCCKYLEHIVYSSIFCHLKKYNIYTRTIWFPSWWIMWNFIMAPINDFANSLNKNSQTDCIFLDFSKAFNRVPHNRLCKNYLIMVLENSSSCGLNSIFLTDIKE